MCLRGCLFDLKIKRQKEKSQNVRVSGFIWWSAASNTLVLVCNKIFERWISELSAKSEPSPNIKKAKDFQMLMKNNTIFLPNITRLSAKPTVQRRFHLEWMDQAKVHTSSQQMRFGSVSTVIYISYEGIIQLLTASIVTGCSSGIG